jgi:hypothetical protein
MAEPKCVEVSVQHSGGGRVTIVDFGKVQSNWGVSMSRRFEIPADWSQKQIDDFQLAENNHLHELIEPIDQDEYEVRYEQRDW